jgi:hypothetical protein
MLELRPSCEHCNTDLPNTTSDAMICTFECTFCSDCANTIFENVCPNCGGNFVPRPIRPAKFKDKYPASNVRLHAPKDLSEAKLIIDKYKGISPNKR